MSVADLHKHDETCYPEVWQECHCPRCGDSFRLPQPGYSMAGFGDHIRCLKCSEPFQAHDGTVLCLRRDAPDDLSYPAEWPK